MYYTRHTDMAIAVYVVIKTSVTIQGFSILKKYAGCMPFQKVFDICSTIKLRS